MSPAKSITDRDFVLATTFKMTRLCCQSINTGNRKPALKLTWISLAAGILFVAGLNSNAAILVTFTPSEYDNANPPTTGLFRDFLDEATPPVALGTNINQGDTLGTVTHTALNFTASIGSGGGSGITLYDTTPGNASAGTQSLFTGSINLSADILFNNRDNAKDVGVLALFNEGSGQKGLALLLRDAGNNDRSRLTLVSQDDAESTVLLSVPASGSNETITENVWYRLAMNLLITGDAFSVTGMVFPHVTPTDPDSALGLAISSLTLNFSGSLSAQGLSATGQVGLAADYTLTAVNASVTNFNIDGTPAGVAAVPEPLSVVVWSLLGLATFGAVMLRK